MRRIKSTCAASVEGTDVHAGVSPSEVGTRYALIYNWSRDLLVRKTGLRVQGSRGVFCRSDVGFCEFVQAIRLATLGRSTLP